MKFQVIIIIIIIISIQQNTNSIIKTAAKITEELSRQNERSDTKQDTIQHTKARLGEPVKKKWKNKEMHQQYIKIQIDNLLVKKTRSSGYRRETYNQKMKVK